MPLGMAAILLILGSSLAGATDSQVLPMRDLAKVNSMDIQRDGPFLHALLTGPSIKDGKPLVSYLRSKDGGDTWSDPIRVDDGGTVPHAHRGNDLQIASEGQQLVAVWPIKGTGFRSSGPFASAFSKDGGRSWQPGPNPADDGNTDGHGFLDLVTDHNGRFHAVWLDNREKIDRHQALRHARSDDGGAHWSKNVTIDPSTCFCCWNTLLPSGKDDLMVLYRGAQPRDMTLSITKNQGKDWQGLGRVGKFDWKFNGCPHSGGSITASDPKEGNDLHAVVWTGEPSRLGLHYLHSNDRGGRWTEPKQIGGKGANHGDVVNIGAGKISVIWDEITGPDTMVAISHSQDGGNNWTTPERLSEDGKSASHPKLINSAQGLRAFWTELDETDRKIWIMAKISKPKKIVVAK